MSIRHFLTLYKVYKTLFDTIYCQKVSFDFGFCESKFDSNFVITIGVDFKNKVVQRWGRKVRRALGCRV